MIPYQNMYAPQWYGTNYPTYIQQPMQYQPSMQNSFQNQMPQNPQFQPQMPQAQQSQQPQEASGFHWVQGEAAARAFVVEPGKTVLLMDSDAPVLYVKSTDLSGKPSPMIAYELVDRKETSESASNIDMSEYVKRYDLEAIIEKSIEKKMSEIKFQTTPVSGGSSTTPAVIALG